MRTKHAARSADGRYSNFGLRVEESARNAKRMPTTSHDGRRSVGTHTGKMVREVNGDCADLNPQTTKRRAEV